MDRIDNLNVGQRVILVAALAETLRLVGTYLVGLGSSGGWFGYAPNTATLFVPHTGLRPGLRLVVWLVLIAAWTLASLRILRSRPTSEQG